MLKNLNRSSLSELSIRSLGVIQSSEVEFKSGLTVITGETGAGKTMILTALNLILGGKADSDFVRVGDERLVVSGRFNINKELTAAIEGAGGFVEDGELIVNRSVTNQGKSKITLGGVASTASQIATIAEDLIEIHAQSSTARLSKPAIQRDLLDLFGGHSNEISAYGLLFENYAILMKRISELKKQLAERDREISKIEDFVKDYAKVNPKFSEITELENEINRLGSVEELNSGVVAALAILDAEDPSPISALIASKKYIETLRSKDSALDALIERYGDLIYELQEIKSGLESYTAKLEADPVRFDFIQNRKSEILQLIKEYGEGTDRDKALSNLIEEASIASEKLADLRGGDARLAELEKERLSLFGQLRDSAATLSACRLRAADQLSRRVSDELSKLAMPNAEFVSQVTSSSGESITDYTSTGLDEVIFLFTAHKDGKSLPISKAASGGELSRVMLAIEVVLAVNSPVGTYIFDEVDAGVGGKAAVEVGKRLALLAKSAQVIVVTHLAQVASWADNHLVVTKSEDGSVTQSDIATVIGEDRRREIARLLSGQEDSKTAQQHAGELLELVAAAQAEMIG